MAVCAYGENSFNAIELGSYWSVYVAALFDAYSVCLVCFCQAFLFLCILGGAWLLFQTSLSSSVYLCTVCNWIVVSLHVVFYVSRVLSVVKHQKCLLYGCNRCVKCCNMHFFGRAARFSVYLSSFHGTGGCLAFPLVIDSFTRRQSILPASLQL